MFIKSPVYIWYSEETFDDKYKANYPQFFISSDAPKELREKYYNPKIIYKDASVRSNLDNEVQSVIRQTLTLDEYIQNYQFLKGKYLGNFSISKQDLIQIELIEKYGLEKREIILEYIKNMMEDISKTAECENCTINEVDDLGVSLTLKLKFKK